MTINKANSVFIVMVILGLIIWSQVSLLLLHEIFNYHVLASVFNFRSASLLNYHSTLYSVLSICMNIIIIYSLVLVFWRLTVQGIKAFRWNNFLKAQQQNMVSNQLMSEYAYLQTPIIVIPNDHPIVFTTGILHPKIVVSKGIINRLSENNLKAVILTQYNHCKNYNPLRSLIAWIIKESLPFIPIQRRLFYYLRVWMEIQADSYAAKMTHPDSCIHLILLTCHSSPEAAQYRIQHIQKKSLNIRVPFLSVSSIVVSLSILFILSLFVLSIGS